MARVALLLQQSELCQRVSDWLTPYYDVMIVDENRLAESSFDLCVVDNYSLHHSHDTIQASKDAEHPACLPVLLVTSPQVVGEMEWLSGHDIDDLIVEPFQKFELMLRVQTLLRLRELSQKDKNHEAAFAKQDARLYEQTQTLLAIEERQRIVRDLHDTVSQTLFSVSVMAESLARQWERDPNKVWQRLSQLHQLTRGALAETRLLVLELRPTFLADTELEELLHQLVDTFQSRKTITTSFTIEESQCCLPPQVKIAVYRIAQEALSNVIKHSRASQLIMNLKKEPGQVELYIRDNGRGFEFSKVPGTSLGLKNMQERAQAVGASLHISTQVGYGTEVVTVWSDG
jgi:signal transduction histidine kinase